MALVPGELRRHNGPDGRSVARDLAEEMCGRDLTRNGLAFDSVRKRIMNPPGAFIEPRLYGHQGVSYIFQTMGTSAPESSAFLTAPARGGALDLSVIIVNYNVREFLEQAVRSVLRSGERLRMEVFVVDNNSVDGSAAMVRTQFPQVHLIVNGENVGFSRANNQAIRQASGKYLLILNPDTIVREDTFETLIGFMEAHRRAGAVGCKILHPDGSFARESRRAFPTPQVAFYRMVGLASLLPRSRTFGRYNMTYLPDDEVAEVDALSGSCMLVRRAALYEGFDKPDAEGAGLLDEDYFMYGEDIDWCYRIRQAGWKIYYTPQTQIIHYKGESTKKGELRYVRLFYGAMLRFTEKHFEYRYSRVFAFLLRAGILFRAAFTVAGKALRTFAWPIVDFLAVYFSAAVVAVAHSAALGARPSLLFFAAVAPAYALGAVAGTGAAGGYGLRRRIRSVWAGIFVGMLVVASVSFFVKDIAFSRVVILLTYPAACLAASMLRLAASRRVRERSGARHAVLVGQRDEALRLGQMLARHPRPPFVLAGYVVSDDGSEILNGRNGTAEPARLGRISQLRDIVRLGHVDDVVFASAAVSNEAMFGLIQQLRDLPVHFRILAEGRDHVIGKASVDDLSMVNLVEAEDALVHARSPAARRTFDLIVGLIGLLVHPFVAMIAYVSGPGSFAARIAGKTGMLTKVLVGSHSVVGYGDDAGFLPPPEWNLKPGVFAVIDALDFTGAGPEEIGTAYWFYVRNQSASLDWDIVVRSLRQLRGRSSAV